MIKAGPQAELLTFMASLLKFMVAFWLSCKTAVKLVGG